MHGIAKRKDNMVAFSLERTLQEKPLSDNAIDFQGVIYTKMAVLSHTELYVHGMGLGRCTESTVIRLVVGTNLTSPPHRYTQKTHFLDLLFQCTKIHHTQMHPYTHQ